MIILSIVSTNIPYNSNILTINLYQLLQRYPFLNLEVIGTSVLGKPIYSIRLGRGKKNVFYSASIHANEWITSIVLMKFIEDYCNAYVEKTNLYNKYIPDLFNSTSIYIAPMINPDGVNLVTNILPTNSYEYQQALNISNNFPDIPFPNGWKANINGVDLNLQFPAGWEQAKEIKYSQGFNKPSPRDFVGYGPLTEPESLAIYNFTLRHNFSLILAYHSQGEVIYWQFQDYIPPMSLEIGEQLANSSGYSLEETPYNSSFAGYKDWFIQNYNRPGYTIEVGLGENPLPISQFDKIYNDNIGILILGATL